MSKVIVCDVCGKKLDKGLVIVVEAPKFVPWSNVSEYLPEIGTKDICLECYKDVKSYILNKKGVTDK